MSSTMDNPIDTPPENFIVRRIKSDKVTLTFRLVLHVISNRSFFANVFQGPSILRDYCYRTRRKAGTIHCAQGRYLPLLIMESILVSYEAAKDLMFALMDVCKDSPLPLPYRRKFASIFLMVEEK